MLRLEVTKASDPRLRESMQRHYSQPTLGLAKEFGTQQNLDLRKCW